MKIGIDVRALQWAHRYRGVGVYLSRLLEALSKIDHKNHYTLYAWDKPNPLEGLKLDRNFNWQIKYISEHPAKLLKNKLSNRFARQIKIPPGEVDIFFQPDIEYGLAKTKIPQVAVAYDLIQLLFREQHFPKSATQFLGQGGIKRLVGSKLGWHIYKWGLKQLSRADHIIAISEATKRDLIRLNNIKPQKISAIALAASKQFKPTPGYQVTLRKYGLNKPYLLYVGASDYRKNIEELVEAFEHVKQTHDVELVLVGKAFEAAELKTTPKLESLLASSPHKHSIKTLGYLKQEETTDLYSAAAAFVFPSFYEGFGMPILEAMGCGCPVIAYNTSSIPEVAGEAALLVKPGEDLAKPIERLLIDNELRDRLRAAGLQQASRFSWDNTARMTLQVFNQVAKK